MVKDKNEVIITSAAESNAITDDSFVEVAKDSGLKPEQALDYRHVDQGRNVEPKPQGAVKAKGGKKDKKDKKTAKTKKDRTAVKRTIRDEAVCGFCGNSMTQSVNMNWHALEGVKLPKKYKSPPGAPQGKAVGVWCDDCENATPKRDFRTAVVETIEDGTIKNIPVENLV